MKPKFLFFVILTTTFFNTAFAQGTEAVLEAAMLSYFTGGFALLFIATFLFSFAIKTIINQKTKKNTSKEIVFSSLRIAFATALALIFVIYLFLSY
jgi:hypothetical protein